ncbi:MAG: ABC transporter substrate-binding protein [Roseinatronobacter sp.]|nr:ABC transporter substrate-binding protein [Roseinatronobacter sp.]
MKKLLLASTALAFSAGMAIANEIKIGVLLGFTGGIESLTPHMAAGAELAMREVSESGVFLEGTTVTPVRGDTGLTDNALAQASAERLISSDGVVALMGPDGSGVTRAVLENVAMAQGIPVISPSATSPAFSNFDSGGLFYRTAPSDARQGQLLAEIITERGINSVAVTYVNADYGSGLTDAFVTNFEALGGNVTVQVSHEDGRGDYSAEVGTLAAAGGDALVVLGYLDGGGSIIRAAWELGAFESFFVGDGVFSEDMANVVGADAAAAIVGTSPAASGEAAENWERVGTEAGILWSSVFVGESYDAAALLLLAAQAAGEATPQGIAANVLRVANGPGEEIMAGDLARGLEILAAGGEINYIGATGVNLIGPGEAAGGYREYTFVDGVLTNIRFH